MIGPLVKFKLPGRGLASVGVIAGIMALSLVVASPANAWAPPTDPKAPPRVTAPAPTTFKPPTTAVTPKSMLTKVPVIGLSTVLDDLLLPWLQSIAGNTSNPTLGCVGTDGKFSSSCSDPAAKPATAPNNGLVVPDTLWGAVTGKDLNPLLLGQSPANTSVSQFTPTITAPSNGKPGWVSFTWKGKQGSLCSAQPTWYSCSDPNWENSDRGWMGSTATFKVRCKVVTNGGFTGQWNGSGNMPAGSSNSMGGMPAGPSDKQVCKDDGSQIVDFVKANPVPAPYPYAPSFAPGVYVNPNTEIYKDTVFTSNLTCKNSSGASVTVSKTGVAGTGIVPTVQCPEGYLPDSGNTSVGSAFLDAPTKVEEWQITPETRETYPDCIGWQSAGCIMRVELDGVDCSPGNPACYDWAEIQRLQPSRIKCKWGSYTIDISNCLPLRNAYQSESGISAAPSQAPGAAPLGRDVFGRPVQPNADPASPPSWQPDYGTPTNPAPTTGGTTFPDSGPNPFPPTNPNPVPPGEPQPLPPATPSGSANCNSPSWSWNPVDWVYSPIVCAAIDLVMPKLDVPARVNELGQIAGTKAPISWMNPTMVGPSGSGCPNWVVNLPEFSKNVVCDSTFTAAIVGARGPLFGLVAGAMVWPLFRSLWYAAIPILRVTPASSK